MQFETVILAWSHTHVHVYHSDVEYNLSFVRQCPTPTCTYVPFIQLTFSTTHDLKLSHNMSYIHVHTCIFTYV